MLNFNLKENLSRIAKEYATVNTIAEKCNGLSQLLTNYPESVLLESVLTTLQPFEYLPLVKTFINESQTIAFENHNKFLLENTYVAMATVNDPVVYAVKNRLETLLEKNEDEIAESLTHQFGEYSFIPLIGNLRNAVTYHTKGYKVDENIKFESLYSPVLLVEKKCDDQEEQDVNETEWTRTDIQKKIAEMTAKANSEKDSEKKAKLHDYVGRLKEKLKGVKESVLVFSVDNKFFAYEPSTGVVSEHFDRVNEAFANRVEFFKKCFVNEGVITYYGSNGRVFKIVNEGQKEQLSKQVENIKKQIEAEKAKITKLKEAAASRIDASKAKIAQLKDQISKLKTQMSSVKESVTTKFFIGENEITPNELGTQLPFALGLNEGHLAYALIDLFENASSVIALDDIVKKVTSPVNENVSFNVFRTGSRMFLNKVNSYTKQNYFKEVEISEAVEVIKGEFGFDISESVKDFKNEKDKLVAEAVETKNELLEKLHFLNEQKSTLVNSELSESKEVKATVKLLNEHSDDIRRELNALKIEFPAIFEGTEDEGYVKASVVKNQGGFKTGQTVFVFAEDFTSKGNNDDIKVKLSDGTEVTGPKYLFKV